MPLVLIKSDARAREKPCLRCGTSLRKLIDAKYCPQCGLAVWLSLNNNDALDCSNPSWLRRLTIAASLLAAAQLAGLAMWMAMAPFVHRMLELPSQWLAPAVCLIGGVYFIVYNLALLLLMMPERRYPDRLKVHRWAAIVVAGFGLVVGALLLSGGLSGGPKDIAILPPLLNAVVLAESLATFAYLYKLARRVPNSLLARLCGYLMLLPLLSLAKSFPLFACILAFEAMRALEYLPWIYLPISMALLIWFAAVFSRAARAAAKSWDAETEPSRRSHETPVKRRSSRGAYQPRRRDQ